MKYQSMKSPIVKSLAMMTLLYMSCVHNTAAQGSAFTYQGRLTDNGALANGAYDFQFGIFATATGGNALANAVTVNDLAATEGIFTALLDFGAGVFNGADRFLEISVRAGNSGGPFRTVSPRQRVTPTPYAIVAGNINGAGSINASQLTIGTVPTAALNNAWKTTGNSGTTPPAHFLGTTDNQPLELSANGHRALRIEPNTNGAPNLIGGAPVNFVLPSVVGATISGGGATNYFGAMISNSVNRDFSTIGGGMNNTVEAGVGTIAGGEDNFIGPKGVGGAIGGGSQNTNSGAYSTVPGGRNNRAQGNTSFAAGNRAKANHNGAFVWSDSQAADFASSRTDQFLIRAANGVGIGTTNPSARLTVAGSGAFNSVSAAAIVLTNTAANGHAWQWHALDDGRMQLADFTLGDSRMVITTNGNVGIATANPNFVLEVNGSAGKPGGGSWSSTSDARLKKNIHPLSGALDKLLALRGVSFEYIAPEKIHELSGERIGLIAQEVEKVLPDWVETGPNGYKRVTVRGLEALIVEALRELQERQEAQLAALKRNRDAEIQELQQRLERLEQSLLAPSKQ
jgi:hypothetical protein